MIFSETKREMKTKDDKMLTFERYSKAADVTFLDVLVGQNDMVYTKF